MVFSFVLAGAMEAISTAGILSLLTIVLDETQSAGFLARTVRQAFELVGMSPSLPGLLLLLVAVAAAKSALTFFAMTQAGYTAAHVTANLRMALLQALLHARWSFFAYHSVGESANALATEAQRAAITFLSGSQALAALIVVLFYAAMAFLISWQVSLLALSAGAILFIAVGVLVRRARKAGKRQTKSAKSLVANFTAALSGLKAVKAMGRQGHFSRMLERDVIKLRESYRRQVWYQNLLPSISEPLTLGIVAVGLVLTTTFFQLPLAELLVLGLIALRIMQRVFIAQKHVQRAATTESALWSLWRAKMEADERREKSDGSRQPTLNHGIALKDVSFSYANSPLIADLCLDIPACSFAAVYGPSGSGKTTLVDLIIGLHQPQSGEVLIDGIPLKDIDLQAWRQRIGYVPQDTYLFHDTILANIALGDESIDAMNAEVALREADAWEFVSALPQGMATVVGEGGGRLSGGQRQRIAIARAIARKPLLMILDEATSALDPRSEQEILQTVCNIARKITVIAVSHNPAVAATADLVFELSAMKDPRSRPRAESREPVRSMEESLS